MPAVQETVARVREIDVDKYKYGFFTDIESVKAPKGLSEEVVRFISAKKNEPEWLLDWRLEAYRRWLTMQEPTWANVHHPKIDYQDLYYYSAPKSTEGPKSLAEVDPELLKTYAKLGIPLKEQEVLAGVEGAPRVAVDAVFDSVSVVTTFKEELGKAGVIFCSISEAVKNHPELVKKYLGSVVPITDNFYATLNSAVFSDGSFVYVPPGVRCPMELSTYFRINAESTGQFERTLIIADEGSEVTYMEGCTAPKFNTPTLHSAVVELVALKGAKIQYITVQNWASNVFNLVTKRGLAQENAEVKWIDCNIGSRLTMKYPSVIMKGRKARGEVLSIALANDGQHQDTGAKMIHAADETTSNIISKSISIGKGRATYRGLVHVPKHLKNCKNNTECDALLINSTSRTDTYPAITVRGTGNAVQHEASVSQVSAEQIFYMQQRCLSKAQAMSLSVNGFVNDLVRHFPMEYSVELKRLIELQMEGSVG
jgi:Fe-S cluster assembly protein SufB